MRNQIVVATYGDFIGASNRQFSMWWIELEAWAKEIGIPPNEISAAFEKKPRGLIANNGYEIERYRERFAEQLRAGNVSNIELMRVWPEDGYKTLDWDFYGMYGRDPFAGSVHAIGTDLDRLHSIPPLSALGFAHEVVRRSRPYLSVRYGFAVSMPRSFMPGGYAIGVAAELPKEMIWDCTAWRRFAGKECDRTIRNVFGYSILNGEHLDIDVGGQRLEDWIKASVRRGRIELLEGGSPEGALFLWTFQEGDDQEKFLWWDYPPVVAVREELKKFKVFPWQRLAGVE